MGNSTVKNLVADGTCYAGWTDTDDYFLAEDAGRPVAMIPARTPSGRTICIPNTVSIIRGTARPLAAQRLVDYLLSADVELALAQSASRQVPLGAVRESQLPEQVQRLRPWVAEGVVLPQLDAGLPALLRDIDDRGRLDSTLIVVMGEFGRTPRVNQHAGRDHWGPANTILLAGGGIRHGLAIGKTNDKGERPDGNPHGPEDLAATMYHLLGIDGEEEFLTPEGRPVKIVNDGRVVRELV